MTRRNLFRFFTAAAIAADPDKLLWTPGEKMISIPHGPMIDQTLQAWMDSLQVVLQEMVGVDPVVFGGVADRIDYIHPKHWGDRRRLVSTLTLKS